MCLTICAGNPGGGGAGLGRCERRWTRDGAPGQAGPGRQPAAVSGKGVSTPRAALPVGLLCQKGNESPLAASSTPTGKHPRRILQADRFLK